MTNRSAVWPALLEPGHHGRDDLCAVSAKGVRIGFSDGVERLDGISGLWNANLGFGNRAITAAITDALNEASYLSVFRYENVYARKAAEALIVLAGSSHYGRVMFSTSGGAANDAAMKIVRHTQLLRDNPGKRIMVSLEGSYHGLTFGGFALTGEDLGQAGYGVDQRLVAHVPPNDRHALDGLIARMGHRVGGIVVEPVLGSGAVVLNREFLSAVFKARKEHGIVVVADEVATGFGRTGPMFGSLLWDEPPDLLITSKGLTNGTCAGAAILVASSLVEPIDASGSVVVHGETQAGTPPTAAAICATIAEFERLDALASGQEVSENLDSLLDALGQHRAVSKVTGVGCFRSIRLTGTENGSLSPAKVPALVDAIRRAGAIVHPSSNGVQILPALTMNRSELVELTECIEQGIGDFLEGDASTG